MRSVDWLTGNGFFVVGTTTVNQVLYAVIPSEHDFVDVWMRTVRRLCSRAAIGVGAGDLVWSLVACLGWFIDRFGYEVAGCVLSDARFN